MRGKAKIYDGIAKGDDRFREADLFRGLDGKLGPHDGLGIGEPNVFVSRHEQATLDGIEIPGGTKAREVIEGGIHVASTNRFLKGGNGIVMFFPVLIHRVIRDFLDLVNVFFRDDRLIPKLQSGFFQNVEGITHISARELGNGEKRIIRERNLSSESIRVSNRPS